jgi:lipopolysaccharide transport system ATP-binding protein
MSTVIKIENLYKEYRLGVIGHGTLYRDLQSWWAKMRSKPDPNSLLDAVNPNHGKDRILALKDINLEVNDGEVLGIIGANGAGKSTLLKILSKVTAPTKGTIKYKGRIASLLEVGTGFHTELTGRENIYLNGAINGMNKREVNKKLEEIVAFADVEKFLDTPVKRYSSGMFVRLGFAVAAHLDPDILVVDEVLAVGDASFQKKAIGKMQTVSKDKGRTVLFVSHNMSTIKNLCERTILIDKGKIIKDGKSGDVIDHYLSLNDNDSGAINFVVEKNLEDDIAKLKSVKIFQDGKDNPSSRVDICKDVIIEITYINFKSSSKLGLNIWLDTITGIQVLSSSNDEYVCLRKDKWNMIPHPKGTYVTTCRIPGYFLNEGEYSIVIFINKYPGRRYDNLQKTTLTFKVVDTGEMRKSGFYGGWRGVVRPRLDWSTEFTG